MKESNDLEIDNLPNRLTMMRMVLIPVVIGALYMTDYPTQWVVPYQKYLGHFSCWLFVIAAATDFFDGYIARKRNIVTVFGSFLDPIADKFLVVSSLIMLMGLERIHPLIVIILVLREMYMTSLRLLGMSEDISVPVSQSAKWKTTIQMISIPMLMIYDDFLGIDLILLGTVLIFIASFLSLWSAIIYSLNMIKKLKAKRKLKKVKTS